MKRFILSILVATLLLTIGCSGNENKDYAGVLENMNIDYDMRKDTITMNAWWEPATSIEDNHLLFVLQSDQALAVESLEVDSMCKDTLTCDGIYYDDASFSRMLQIVLIDYKYRQVYLMIKRPEIEQERFESAIQSVLETVHQFAPQAEVFFLTNNASDAEAVTKIGNVTTYLYRYFSDLKETLQQCVEQEMSPVTSVRPEGAMDEEYIQTKRESIEWSQFGFQKANSPENKPRLLLIGDSISWGYGPYLNKYLDGYAIDYLRTSRGVDDKALARELEFILAQYRYDAIHFNIGLHFHGLDADGYAVEMGNLVNNLRRAEPSAKLYFCNTTSIAKMTSDAGLVLDESASSEVRLRNEKMFDLCNQEGIPYFDLYTFAIENNLTRKDTVHYIEAAYDKMAERLAAFIVGEI